MSVNTSVSSPNFNKNFDPQPEKSIKISDELTRITASNAGPYTFTGTNTFVIGTKNLFILDPGPSDADHLDAILQEVNGRTVDAVLLTHTHIDHSALVPKLQASLGGVPVWFGGAHRLSRPKRRFEVNLLSRSCDWDLQPDRELHDGEEIEVEGVALNVIATPGHCANHIAFGVKNTPFLLCGDHVMGWNSTLVATPDGSMADYFASIDRLLAAPFNHYLPAHGGPIEYGLAHAVALKDHRMTRNQQILDGIQNGAQTLWDLVKLIYPQADGMIARAAAMTLQAHVEYLADLGKL